MFTVFVAVYYSQPVHFSCSHVADLWHAHLLLPLQVILAANAGATINDITAAELQPLLSAAGAGDELLGSALASGQLQVISSGNDMPVIDVSRVSRI